MVVLIALVVKEVGSVVVLVLGDSVVLLLAVSVLVVNVAVEIEGLFVVFVTNGGFEVSSVVDFVVLI